MSLAAQTKMAAITSVKAVPGTSSIEIQFRDDQNLPSSVHVPVGALAALVSALVAGSRSVQPGGPTQLLHATAARAFAAPDGRSGLEITVEGSLRVPIVFPRDGIPALRQVVDALEGVIRSTDSGAKH